MIHVRRARDAEVATIQCRNLRLTEMFDGRENARVHEPERKIGVGVNKRRSSSELVVVWKVSIEPAGAYVCHQRRKASGPRPEQILHLDQHGERDYAPLAGCSEQLCAALVVRVAAINQRDQRTRVEDQRHASGRYSRSPP